MSKYWLTLANAVLLANVGHAGLFDFSSGAMNYGPYTGGHAYSYNVAYGYGFAFSPADTWRRDIFAYPGGVAPYRPNEWPIVCTVFPRPAVPYVSVPGPDGLYRLVPAGSLDAEGLPVVSPGAVAGLQPVPAGDARLCARIRVIVPAGAEVWFDKTKTTQDGTDRVFETPPLTPGKTHIYTVRARWTDGTRDVEQFRVMGVRAGETAKLTFTANGQ
jgi:uncharacterized protein (TIGR03000 family)